MMHKLLKTVAGVSLFTAVSTAALAADNANDESLQSLIDAAKKEGVVYSLGMPDPWANWVETWNDIKTNYGIEHFDTDMSSAQEIAKFEAEKNNASGDIGDIGEAFTSIAVKKGVTIPYKPTTWDSIPNWAKDKDGHWVIAYTGTISFLINKEIVKNPPKSWADLLEGDYKITVGDVGIAAQANNAILAAAIGLGGSEKDLKPALDFFGKLAKQDRLIFTDPSLANIEKGENSAKHKAGVMQIGVDTLPPLPKAGNRDGAGAGRRAGQPAAPGRRGLCRNGEQPGGLCAALCRQF